MSIGCRVAQEVYFGFDSKISNDVESRRNGSGSNLLASNFVAALAVARACAHSPENKGRQFHVNSAAASSWTYLSLSSWSSIIVHYFPLSSWDNVCCWPKRKRWNCQRPSSRGHRSAGYCQQWKWPSIAQILQPSRRPPSRPWKMCFDCLMAPPSIRRGKCSLKLGAKNLSPTFLLSYFFQHL